MEETPYARRAHVARIPRFRHVGSALLVSILLALNLALVASALLLDFLTPGFLLPVERPATTLVVAPCLLSLASSAVGSLVASRFPRNPVGWILCGIGLVYGARRLAVAYADYALLAHPRLPLGELAAWASTWTRFSVLIALGTLLALLFPDGRLPSPRWRPVVLATGCGALLIAIGDAIRVGPLPTYYYVVNPFGIGVPADGIFPAASFAEVSTIAGGALLSVSCFASIAALALRLRLAYGPERRHLEWFAFAAVPAQLLSAVILLNWSIERYGLLFFGSTLSPVLWIAEITGWFVEADQTAGTIIALGLDADLEFLGIFALLMVPVCVYVAIHNHGLYGITGTALLAAPRWVRALLGGAIVGALPFAFVYLAVYLYVIFYPLGGRGQQDEEQLERVVGFVGGWGAHAFFFAAAILMAFQIARKVDDNVVLLGLFTGLIAAFANQAITSLINPPVTPVGFIGYTLLGLAGGYFGSLAGRSTLSGGVYRVSRQIGKAKDASAVAGAIGENLGGPGVDGVALWRIAGPEDQATSVDAGSDRLQYTLWGSWRTNGQEDWPSGLDPGEEGAAVVVAPGEQSWAAVQRPALTPGKKISWEHLGIGSAILVPLGVTGETWKGLMMVTFRKRLRFSRRTVRAYLTVASQAALALENLRLVEEALRAGRQGGILLERQRLAREIHDTLAQGFTGVITNLTAAELTSGPRVVDATYAQYINDAKRIARDSLAETRRLVWALRPQALDRYSLPEAVERLVEAWAEQTGVDATVATNGVQHELLPEAEAALIRAAQEALTNVHKHARASMVNVTLTYMKDRVVIDVLDDGDGFEPTAVTTTVGAQDEGGFGLTAMRERVEQLGGKLIVESAPGEGTTIVVELRVSDGLGALEEIR